MIAMTGQDPAHVAKEKIVNPKTQYQMNPNKRYSNMMSTETPGNNVIPEEVEPNEEDNE